MLQEQLDEIMGDSMTYVAPQSGSYRNTVTFEDINGDGEDEAIAFLREGTGGTIYVYAFELQGEEYKQIGCIEGQGSVLGSLSFLQQPNDEGKAIVLTWTLSGDVKQGLTVCSMQDDELIEVLDVTYTSYTVCDLDEDDGEELFVVNYDDGRKVAQLYDYANGEMGLLSQTDATQDVQTIANIAQGDLDEEGQEAIFVDNKFENDNGMQTDIYVLDDNKLRNVALSSDISTYRSVSLYYSEDIDGDGIIEVPQLTAMPGYEEKDTTDTLWMIDWYCFHMDGSASRTQTTYDSSTEGWTLTFPKKWRGNVTATTVSETGVSQTVFQEVGSEDPLLTIYVFTGEDREEAAIAGGLIDLGSTSDSCFAAQLGSGGSPFLMTEAQVTQAFSIVQSEWS